MKVLAMSAAIALSGCGAHPTANAARLAIVGGSPPAVGSPGDTSAVGLVMWGRTFCSGVVVADNLVMTAAHCARGVSNPGDVSIRFGADALHPAADAARMAVAVGWNEAFDTDTYPNFDIGWLKFEGGLPAGYRPMPVLGDAGGLMAGTPVTLAGFGDTGDQEADAGVRRTVDSVVNRVVDTDRYHDLLLIGPTPGRGVCHSDSGGPIYAQTPSGWAVVATVTSLDFIDGHDLTCAAGRSITTLSGRYADWVERTSGVELQRR